MPYKIVEVSGKKYAELGDNDHAILVHADGTETAFDADGASARIAALNAEQATRRHENNDLKTKLKSFEGIEDGDAARAALEVVKNLEVGELKNVKQVQEIKDQAKIAAEAMVAAAQKKSTEDLQKAETERNALRDELHREKIGGGLARSKYVVEKLSIPPDMVENFFGKNFKLEEGKIVGYDNAGGKLYSKKIPGELADLEESIEMLVSSYPNKEHILKGAGGGSGGGQGAGDRGGLSKEAFDKLDPVAKMNVARGIRPQAGAGR